jgi:hypothetical protein
MFCAGWVFAAVSPYAFGVNAGLVNALDNVGKNLFGAAVFGARLAPTDPCVGASCGVQLDIATDVKFPARVGVFQKAIPTDPCRQVAQIEVVPPITNDTPPAINVIVDQALQPGVIYRDLSTYVPNVARCNAITVPGG